MSRHQNREVEVKAQEGDQHAGRHGEGLINTLEQTAATGQGHQFHDWKHLHGTSTAQRQENATLVTALQGGEGHNVSDAQLHKACQATDMHCSALSVHIEKLQEQIRSAQTLDMQPGNNRSRS